VRLVCPAYQLGQDYLSGTPNRQDYLETTLDWISAGKIEDYMSAHQHDPDAKPLYEYLKAVLAWVQQTFPQKRKTLMKGLPWGRLYNEYKDTPLDPTALETQIAALIQDDDVQRKAGAYEYVLTGKEKHLSLRTFTDGQKLKAFERQKGQCPVCKKTFELHQMEGDHITPWHQGGKTTDANLQMLCKEDNRLKGGK
jgi:hypothetical protein